MSTEREPGHSVNPYFSPIAPEPDSRQAAGPATGTIDEDESDIREAVIDRLAGSPEDDFYDVYVALRERLGGPGLTLDRLREILAAMMAEQEIVPTLNMLGPFKVPSYSLARAEGWNMAEASDGLREAILDILKTDGFRSVQELHDKLTGPPRRLVVDRAWLNATLEWMARDGQVAMMDDWSGVVVSLAEVDE